MRPEAAGVEAGKEVLEAELRLTPCAPGSRRVPRPRRKPRTVRVNKHQPSEALMGAFGMWAGREQMANVQAYLRKLGAPRHTSP